MIRSAETLLRNKKLGKKIEHWWKAKLNNKLLLSKSLKKIDKLWLQNMKKLTI